MCFHGCDSNLICDLMKKKKRSLLEGNIHVEDLVETKRPNNEDNEDRRMKRKMNDTQLHEPMSD